MKKVFLLLFLIFGCYVVHAQKTNRVELVIDSYIEYYKLNKAFKLEQQRREQELKELELQEQQRREQALHHREQQLKEQENIEQQQRKLQEAVVAKTNVCPAEPDDFYDFFNSTFIDFGSLREGQKVNTFSFSDSLASPLKRDLVVTSVYGVRGNRKHFGVDFRVAVGEPVCSIFCGVVRVAKWDPKYGLVVVIRNYNMSETVYAHLDKVYVRVDQKVEVGQIIGAGGNTGRSSASHLHLELRYKGFPMNPILKDKFLLEIPITYK